MSSNSLLRQEKGTGVVMLATHSSTRCSSWRSTRRRWSTGRTTSTRARRGKTTTMMTMTRRSVTADVPLRLVSSPPSVLGQRRQFLLSKPESFRLFFCCNGSYTGPVYRDFTVPYPSVLWNHIECVFFYFHENTIWTLPHEYLIAEHFDIIPSQRNLKI